MQPGVLQTAEGEMQTSKFLQGERRKTILGELYNKVPGREIERTFKFKTDRDISSIAKVIYDQLKETPRKEAFSLLEVGIIRSMIVQMQYKLAEYEHSFKRKVTVSLYEKEQAAVKIKSPPVREYKNVKVKGEIKYFIPCTDGKKPEEDIREIFRENFSYPLKEGASWKKEKYQIFVQLNENIFTIAISQVSLLQDKENLSDIQRTVPLRRIEVEYQGTKVSDLTGYRPGKESKKSGKQDLLEAEERVEKEIIMQIRKISQIVQKICEEELCLLLITV